MKTRIIFPIVICFVAFFISDSLGKIYKWVDENGKTHFSDKPPLNKEAADLKEYESIEDNIKIEEPKAHKGTGASNVRVSKIKMRVLEIVTHGEGISRIGGSSESSSSGGRSRTAYEVLITVNVASVGDYGGNVRVDLQAVTRDGTDIKKASLSGTVEPGKRSVLSRKSTMMRTEYRKIHKWKIVRVYASNNKRRRK